MRTLHPNIKTENIRAPFELKFGQYTIKLANTLGYLFNGVDVNSFMCTTLGNFNQHLQIGMTSNMNNVFFEIYSNSGEKLSGFDGRILLDGSIVLSSSHQYTYGNNKSQLLSGSFEQKLINSYASHLGINYVTLPSNIQTADMNTQSLSGVQAYMESGVVYKPQ